MGPGTSMRSTTDSLTRNNSLAPAVLSHEERVTLDWVCGALFPRLEPSGSGDDAALFAADALSLGVPGAMEEALAAVPESQAADFKLLLRSLDNPFLMLVLSGRAKSFRALGAEEREGALLAMATSGLPIARRGFQALKRLAAFLFYSVLDEQGSNPTWAAMGYRPGPDAPAREAALRLTTINAPTALECDVCIIGSGAGGGVAAAVLAKAGLRVVVLEQGPADQAPDFDQHEVVGMQRLYLD